MTTEDLTPAQHIDQRIAELGDWRGDLLATARRVAHEAVPDLVEGWKWRGVPTWESQGILTTGETYKDKVKFTFAQGAHLEDPTGLFNSGLEGNQRRVIDLFEGDALDEAAFADMLRRAAAYNAEKKAKKKK